MSHSKVMTGIFFPKSFPEKVSEGFSPFPPTRIFTLSSVTKNGNGNELRGGGGRERGGSGGEDICVC